MTELNIQAIGDKIIGICLNPRQIDLGEDALIVTPESAIKPQMYMKVISVGEDVKTVKKDDVIVVHPNAGMLTIFDTYMCKVVTDGEVYGVLSNEEVSEDEYQVFMAKPKEENRIVTPGGASMIRRT